MWIIQLAWVGTEPTTQNRGLASSVALGLRLELDRSGFWMLKLPDGRNE